MLLRKGFVIVLGCLFCFGLLGNAGAADKPIELSFALHTAPGGPDHTAVEKFKEMVETGSKGKIVVNLFPGGQLGGERDNLEQLKQGEVAMTQSGDLCVSLYAPEYGAAIIPFVFPSVEDVFHRLGRHDRRQHQKSHVGKGRGAPGWQAAPRLPDVDGQKGHCLAGRFEGP